MMLTVLCLASLVAVSSAAICCVPPQWEGALGTLITIVHDNEVVTNRGNVLLAYDAVNRRIAAREYININGDTNMVVDILHDHNTGIKYTVESTSGQPTRCYKQALGSFMEGCIPDNATKIGSNYLKGLGKNSLAASSYEVLTEPFTVYVEVTDKGCIPVEEVSIGSLQGSAFVQTNGYYNITAGITDPSVFTPPAICNNAPMVTKHLVSDSRTELPFGRRATFLGLF